MSKNNRDDYDPFCNKHGCDYTTPHSPCLWDDPLDGDADSAETAFEPALTSDALTEEFLNTYRALHSALLTSSVTDNYNFQMAWDIVRFVNDH